MWDTGIMHGFSLMIYWPHRISLFYPLQSVDYREVNKGMLFMTYCMTYGFASKT